MSRERDRPFPWDVGGLTAGNAPSFLPPLGCQCHNTSGNATATTTSTAQQLPTAACPPFYPVIIMQNGFPWQSLFSLPLSLYRLTIGDMIRSTSYRPLPNNSIVVLGSAFGQPEYLSLPLSLSLSLSLSLFRQGLVILPGCVPQSCHGQYQPRWPGWMRLARRKGTPQKMTGIRTMCNHVQLT